MSAWTYRSSDGKAAVKIVPPRLRTPCWKGRSAESEEKREPASDIDTATLHSLKALDPNRPIREADICGAANSSLFDHLLGEAKQRDWKNQTKLIGSFHIDGKVHPRGLLDGHFGWLCPIQDFANVNANQSISIKKTRPIGNKSPHRRHIT